MTNNKRIKKKDNYVP